MIFRKLKGLEIYITVSVVHPIMPAESWGFDEFPGSTGDGVHGHQRPSDLYQQMDPGYNFVTVPVLYDKQQWTMVNNESSSLFLLRFQLTDIGWFRLSARIV